MNYGEFVYSRAKVMASPTEDLLHAAVGISGEAGELLDAVKKIWVYNKPADFANIKEELGDLCFYMMMICNQQGWSFDELMEENQAKLEKRYPTGYSDAAAQARADKLPEPQPELQVIDMSQVPVTESGTMEADYQKKMLDSMPTWLFWQAAPDGTIASFAIHKNRGTVLFMDGTTRTYTNSQEIPDDWNAEQNVPAGTATLSSADEQSNSAGPDDSGSSAPAASASLPGEQQSPGVAG